MDSQDAPAPSRGGRTLHQSRWSTATTATDSSRSHTSDPSPRHSTEMGDLSPRKLRAERFGNALTRRSPQNSPSRSSNSGSSRVGRLRPAISGVDVLESLGLPSKGETRLQNPETQEWYYEQITARLLTLYSSEPPCLTVSLANLTLEEADSPRESPISEHPPSLPLQPSHPSPEETHTPVVAADQPPPTTSQSSTSNDEDIESSFPQSGKDQVLLALRKLREATLSLPADYRILKYYTFSIRTSILLNSPESYSPSLSHLLRRFDLQWSLRREFASYWVLDLACRRARAADALAVIVRSRHAHSQGRTQGNGAEQSRLIPVHVEQVVYAVIRSQLVVFRRWFAKLDSRQKRIARYAERGLVERALRDVAKAYLRVEMAYLLEITGCKDWDEMEREWKVRWEREGSVVVIRSGSSGKGKAGKGDAWNDGKGSGVVKVRKKEGKTWWE